jgi:orotidine-5'-phosphate decarboxylase
MTAPHPDPPEADRRLIYALDGMSLDEALAAVRVLGRVVKVFKIGPGLVYEGGLAVAARIARAAPGGDAAVFLDLKSWDIPETLRNTLEAIVRHGGDAVALATLHSFGLAPETLHAFRARRGAGGRPRLLGVTLLTSQDQSDLAALGIGLGVEDFVLAMARRAQAAGCDGIVCSGHEVARVRRELPTLLTVVPGIRPAAAGQDDQKRIVTPRQAILAGADHLVVGRPIRQAPDPLAAATAIQAEIQAALAERNATQTA